MTVRIIYIDVFTGEEFKSYEEMRLDQAKKYDINALWNTFYRTRLEDI